MLLPCLLQKTNTKASTICLDYFRYIKEKQLIPVHINALKQETGIYQQITETNEANDHLSLIHLFVD